MTSVPIAMGLQGGAEAGDRVESLLTHEVEERNLLDLSELKPVSSRVQMESLMVRRTILILASVVTMWRRSLADFKSVTPSLRVVTWVSPSMMRVLSWSTLMKTRLPMSSAHARCPAP